MDHFGVGTAHEIRLCKPWAQVHSEVFIHGEIVAKSGLSRRRDLVSRATCVVLCFSSAPAKEPPADQQNEDSKAWASHEGWPRRGAL